VNRIELTSYRLDLEKRTSSLETFDFSLSRGDVCLLSSDDIDDGLTFLKALATLIRPQGGTYRFDGRAIDFSDYGALLSIKKKIAFITSHSALISNLTIRENLIWSRAYHENIASMELDEPTRMLCDRFGAHAMIDLRPSEISPRDGHLVVTIRELAKAPEFLLLENLEDYIGLANFGIFWDVMAELVEQQIPVVFLSNSKSFIQAFSNRKLMISQGRLHEA
jgi:ABC-type lipoprotein export system ATPase subunit